MRNLNIKTIGLSMLCVVFIAACASTPKIDPRVTALQDKLAVLAQNSDLASRGGDELKMAERAVQRVVSPPRNLTDEEIAYNLYAADRLLQTAELSARTRLAEDRRKDLVREQESLILQARTRDAKLARERADQAQQSAAEAMALREKALAEAAEAQKMRDSAQMEREQALAGQRQAEAAAESAMTQAEVARLAAEAEAKRAEMAAQQAAEEKEKALQARAEAEAAMAELESMRGRLSELEAKQTERGLLITLGDVLFEFNKSDLKPGSARNLEPLADVLNERTEQTVIIEGHTDNIGSHPYNMTLSEKRAQAVAQYLEEKGIDAGRLTITGLGPDFPVADNGSDAGRQQNRRVEVILPQEK